MSSRACACFTFARNVELARLEWHLQEISIHVLFPVRTCHRLFVLVLVDHFLAVVIDSVRRLLLHRIKRESMFLHSYRAATTACSVCSILHSVVGCDYHSRLARVVRHPGRVARRNSSCPWQHNCLDRSICLFCSRRVILLFVRVDISYRS